MTDRRARIERVLTGVMRQAFADARTSRFTILGNSAAAAWAASLCEAAGGAPGAGIVVIPATKTALLLGDTLRGDIFLFGDLFFTQLAGLGVLIEPEPASAELAALCGGAETLDGVLQRFFDDRLGWELAAAGMAEPVRTRLRERLDAARFQRAQVGLVPKLGSRTLGIDLFA